MVPQARVLRLCFLIALITASTCMPARQIFAHASLNTPNGGETLTGGDLFTIEWMVDIQHLLLDWDLWYSTAGPDGPWLDIAMDLPAGDPTAGSQHAFRWAVPNIAASNAWVRLRMDNDNTQGDIDYEDVSDAPFSISPLSPSCDLNGNGVCGVGDLNSLLAIGPIAPGVPAVGGNAQFDLDGDGTVDNADVDWWLADAAVENGLTSPYLRGDANLDGAVNGEDFVSWNARKFTNALRWNDGDFNGDGLNGGGDFLLWNQAKFMSSGAVLVPELTANPVWMGIFGWCFGVFGPDNLQLRDNRTGKVGKLWLVALQ